MLLKARVKDAAGSVAWRLYAAVFLSSILFLYAAVAWLAWDAAHDESAMFDNGMRDIATTILWSIPAALEKSDGVSIQSPVYEAMVASQGNSERASYLQIWSADGRLVMKSPLTPSARIWPNTEPGFSWVSVDEARWRVLNLWSTDRQMLVQYGQPEALREAVICEVFSALLKRLFWFILVLIAVMFAVVHWSLRPLIAISAEIAARGTDDLSPIATVGIPSEVVKIIGPFNGLLMRLSDARKNEQRFLSDAAHELRTPLAALRVQAQTALRSTQAGEKEKALLKLVSGIDRTTRVAEQLLNIAHVDAANNKGASAAAFSLQQLVKDVAGLLAADAERKSITVKIADGDCSVNGDPLTIGIAIRNLLENAVRYTPPHGLIEVRVASINKVPTLVVSDNGPGIPASERQKVLERFYRLHASVVEGSGLGLAIVKRVCDSIGATLMLDDAQLVLDDALFAESSRERTQGAGLKVTIQFAAA
jgi:signal transduction histidine kinase